MPISLGNVDMMEVLKRILFFCIEIKRIQVENKNKKKKHKSVHAFSFEEEKKTEGFLQVVCVSGLLSSLPPYIYFNSENSPIKVGISPFSREPGIVELFTLMPLKVL